MSPHLDLAPALTQYPGDGQPPDTVLNPGDPSHPRAFLESLKQPPPQGFLDGTSQPFEQMPPSGQQQPSHPTALRLRRPLNATSAWPLAPSLLATAHLPPSVPGAQLCQQEGAALCPGTAPLPPAPASRLLPRPPESSQAPHLSPLTAGILAAKWGDSSGPLPFLASPGKEPNCAPSGRAGWRGGGGSGQSLEGGAAARAVSSAGISQIPVAESKGAAAASPPPPPPTGLLPLPAPLPGVQAEQGTARLLHSLPKKRSPASVPVTPCPPPCEQGEDPHQPRAGQPARPGAQGRRQGRERRVRGQRVKAPGPWARAAEEEGRRGQDSSAQSKVVTSSEPGWAGGQSACPWGGLPSGWRPRRGAEGRGTHRWTERSSLSCPPRAEAGTLGDLAGGPGQRDSCCADVTGS